MYQKLYKPWTKGNLVIFEHEEVAVSLKTACLACFGDLNLPCLVWQMLMFPLPVRIYLKKNLGDDWLKQRWGSIPQLSENNLKTTYFCFLQLWQPKGVKKNPGESLGNLWAEKWWKKPRSLEWSGWTSGLSKEWVFFLKWFIKARYANLTFLGMPLDLKFLSWSLKNLLIPRPPCKK